jgi:hypothetical protein
MLRNDQYVIKTIFGDNTEDLLGHTFLMGEGFLGHTVAVQQFRFWKDVRNDPRSSVYNQKGLRPRSLFCIPVFLNNSVEGVLFGGSLHVELEETEIKEQVTTYSSLLSLLLTKQDLKESLQNHLLELSTFNEIFQVITSVDDIKRVMYIMVDISINLIRGQFACIVFKSASKHSKVEIVSRGLSSSEINDYGYQVATKAFSGLVKERAYNQPQQGKNFFALYIFFYKPYYPFWKGFKMSLKEKK